MSRTIGPKPYPTTFRRSLPFRRSLVAGGLLTAALLGAAAQAAPEEQRDPISLDLASADLRDVLRTFEHMTESPVDVDPRVEGKVTVRLEKVRWSTALDAICEGSGCTWELTTTSPRRLKIRPRSTGLVQEGLDTPVDLIADGVPASEALTAVAKATGRELSLDGDFSAPVRVLLDGVSAATALKALCESLACEWALTREGNALRVRPAPRSVPVSGEARDVSGELRERLRLSLDLSLAEA
ncbi:MAG: hypothetical protein KDD47_17505, partial [Acidobacteria bacterium]|nr:hypothetical protein [Acidobacteriota bacterium]